MASNSKDTERPNIPVDTSPPVDEKIEDLSKVIEESREKLAEEGAPVRPKKKAKMGRPTNEEVAAKKAAEEQERLASAQAVSQQLTPALKIMVSFPFDYAVKKTGFPGCALSLEEKEALAVQLDAVLTQYLPQIPSKHTPLVVFSTSLLLIAFGKFLEWQAYANAPKNVSPAN